MPSITFSIQYQKNTGLAISAAELINLYFFGIPPVDTQGNKMSDETINFYIEAAQKEIENYLTIKLSRQAIRENRDYFYDDWVQWNYLPATYPVVEAITLKGFVNTSLQVSYPNDWLSFKRQSPDEDLYHRSFSLVPASPSAASIVTGTPIGLTPYMGYFGNKIVPNYWESTYITGFNKIPADILNALGMLASIPIFLILGDFVGGAPGIASKSLGIDGLSQSISTAASGGNSGFGGRIKEYGKILVDLFPRLKSRYVGITLGVL